MSEAFGGFTSRTVAEMLTLAAGAFSPPPGSWYASKSVQEKAKDAFDAINNKIAFAP